MRNKNDITPHEHDVLSGRGGHINSHPGNKLFRRLVDDEYIEYIRADNKGKKTIAKGIIYTIQNAKPPGRFLHLDTNTDQWSLMSYDSLLRKVCQRFREHKVRLNLLTYHDESYHRLQELITERLRDALFV